MPQFDMIAPALGDGASINKENSARFVALYNEAAKQSGADWLVFVLSGGHMADDFTGVLDELLRQNPDAAAFDCRCLPYETPHHIDPVTLKTRFLNAHCFAVNREVFLSLSGFDGRLPAPALAEDLACRIRAAGHTIYYAPRAVFHIGEGSVPEELEEYVGQQMSRLLWASKYKGFSGVFKANRDYIQELRRPRHFPGIRKMLLKTYLRSIPKGLRLFCWRFGNRALHSKVRAGGAPSDALDRGKAALTHIVDDGPLVSVVVRTHTRPGSLQCALQSIANQTYKNHEVIVVEDGAPTAEAMIAQQFPALRVVYKATGEPVGRSAAGNLGLETARGEYINFLDDDDFFYPEHLEHMVAKATAHPEADMVLGCSVAMRTDEDPANENARSTAGFERIHFDRLDIFTMCQMCQIPILSVLFKKKLYLAHGGLLEDIDAHEDWGMWLKYLSTAKRIDARHVDVARATSIFSQPQSAATAQRRMQEYMEYDQTLFHRSGIRFEVSLADMRSFHDGIIADIRHVYELGQLDEYLHAQEHREEFRD